MQRVRVKEVNAGPCKDLGILVGDYLDTYNDEPLTSSPVLGELMKKYSGERHKLRVIRADKVFEIDLTAGKLGILVEYQTTKSPLLIQAEQLKISTTPFIPCTKILRSIDVITAECAFGMNAFKDIFASLTDVIGGRSEAVQNTLRDARTTCLRELRMEAVRIGANAIVGVSLDYSEFSGAGKSMLFLVASGTAVLIEDDSHPTT